MSALDRSVVQARLGLSDRYAAWLNQIDLPEDGTQPVLPNDEQARRLLSEWDTPAAGVQACLEARPNPDESPELWWVMRHAVKEVTDKMGRNLAEDAYSGWPELPERLGPVGKYLYAWVFLATHGETLWFHQEREIESHVSTATFASLGRHIKLWTQGAENWTWMLPIILRGASYRLGRHEYDRYGSHLNVHIPETGRLDPNLSRKSLDQARAFFPRHFPEDPVREFVCHSWLMDDQWAQYLPETSNIVQFQRGFTTRADEPGEWGDNDVLLFVFSRSSDGPTPSAGMLDTLPQETTLQRAYIHHLRQCGHWWTRNGYAPF